LILQSSHWQARRVRIPGFERTPAYKLNTKPQPGGYDLRDPMAGFGNFSPFDDLLGRRYSVNLSMDF